MNNTIVYLLGHYAVGKLTIARALCALTGARLVDNHLINNVVFSLVEADGKTPLPRGVWEAVEAIRNIALGVIETISPQDFSFVLTNALLDDPIDRAWFERVEQMAAARGALFVPVLLECDEDENMRRVSSEGRERAFKHTDVASALQRRREFTVLPVSHGNRMELDTTRTTPEQSAAAILVHLGELAK